MKRYATAAFALCLSGLSTLAVAAEGQDANGCPPRVPVQQEPPGRDLFVPFVRLPGPVTGDELRAVQQVKILAEINKLTVELVKRRSNRFLTRADTPQLVKCLKHLAKQLNELQ